MPALFNDLQFASHPGLFLLLILAFLVDWALDDRQWFLSLVPHPVVFIGNLIGWLEKKLNRKDRSAGKRMIRGMVASLIVIGIAIGVGLGLDYGLSLLPYGWLFELLLVSTLLANRSLYVFVARIGKAMKEKGLDGGREALSHIVSRDPKTLDGHGVARSAIESLSENFSDGTVAPAFWYLIFGLPGILGYKAINTLDSMIGYKSERYKDYGMFAARLDDLVNWVPARLSGMILILAGLFCPRSNPFKGLKVMFKFAGLHASPNAGWPEAAMAGCLDFALGGPRNYPGEGMKGTWIGSGRARLDAHDIQLACLHYAIASLLTVVLVALIFFIGLSL